jgi:hypothetical protein
LQKGEFGNAPIEKPESGNKLPPEPKPCSSRHQKTPNKPYIEALFYEITSLNRVASFAKLGFAPL